MDRPYSVTEVTHAIRESLEGGFQPMWVVGEISNYTHHSSGHRYFSLKDDACQIRCVMWRWAKMEGFKAENGVQVLALGELTVYDRGGQYQLKVSRLIPAGAGQQQAALEALKQRLQEEGLFDTERKRPLPPFPQSVGVVTSRTGAAFLDILNVMGRRFPAARVVLRHASVQGDGAAEAIVQGIRDLNAYGEVDVLIVGRGGGSAEDLAAFNEESVVRAVAASAIPVVSAVGHEVDISLTDLVADQRAATPSAAAEMVVPDGEALKESVFGMIRRVRDAMVGLLEESADMVSYYEERYSLRRVEDLVTQQMQSVDNLSADLQAGLRAKFDQEAEAYRRFSGHLGALSPLQVLSRGYSLTQREDTDRVVVDASTLETGDRLKIRFARGESTCSVEAVSLEGETVRESGA